ncbi:MAG: trigger factor [Thermoanaerobaculales bacterium]|jgi:trigger factor|nr:trigger factor [Thermoanaerobaculales bacterium]
MTYKLTEQANHRVEVEGSLPADVVADERRTIVRSIRARAKLPGFRDGRAPESMIRARFAEDIDKELKEELSQRVWQELMEGEAALQPLTMPQIRAAEIGDDGSFSMTAEMEIRPNYELPDLADAELPEISLDVSDAELDAEIERLAEQQAVWQPVEDEAAADGMLVEADLEGRMEDSDEDPYTESDAQFVLGSDAVPPEVSEALQGARVGDEKTAVKTFPKDDENTDRAGKAVTYTISVKGLKRKEIPEIDDELAVGVGLENLAELKERVHEALERKKKSDRREQWRRVLLDQQQANVDLNELPSSLVQNTVNESINRYAYQMAMQGMGPEDGDFKWEELAAKAEPSARQHVADNLILEQLAAEWDTPVPEAEVDAYIAAEAAQLQVPPAEHKANLAAEEKLDAIRHGARLTLVVDEMIRKAGGEVE